MRSSVLGSAFCVLVLAGAAASAREAPGATAAGKAGGWNGCLPPNRLLFTAVEVEARTYEFAGTCTFEQGDVSTRAGYTIHAQWLPADRVALEVIEIRRPSGRAGRLSLKASCPDDPWLTNASCALVAFLGPDGAPLPASYTGPPIPKSAGRIPEALRTRLLAEAASLDTRPRPVVAAPAEGSVLPDLVDVVLERPKGAPEEFPALYEFRFEWRNPVTNAWVPQPVNRAYVLTCDGRRTFSAPQFINRGRYRLRARFAAPDRAKNPWSAWREFTIPAGP
jgi:hypothetical protein